MRFLFVDRILELVPGEYAKGIKHITASDACLSRDDEGRVTFPSSLIGESLGQLAAWNVMVRNGFSHRPVAGVVSSAIMHRPVYLGETLLLESYIDLLDDNVVQYHSTARVGNEVVFTIENALGPLLPMGDFIDDVEVRRQFQEINRPGDFSYYTELEPLSMPLCIDAAWVPHYTFGFDRLIEHQVGVSLIAEKRVSRSAPYFPDHFPNKPVLPMTVLLESKLNLVKKFLALASFEQKYCMHSMRKIKMNDFVQPGDILTCHMAIKKQDTEELLLTFRSEVNNKRVCVLEMLLIAEGN